MPDLHVRLARNHVQSWQNAITEMLSGCLLPILLTSCQFLNPTPLQPSPERLASARGFVWVTDSSEHFRMHIDSGSIAVRRRDLLKFQLEHARSRVLTLIGEQDYARPIDVFIVADNAAMRRLTKQATNGIAYHRSHVIVLTVTPTWSAIPVHEVFHVIAMNTWGVGPVWLNEGMAVLADGVWQGRAVHEVTRELLVQKKLVSLERLTTRFRAEDATVVYPQAASLLKYIGEQFGIEALKLLWQRDEAGFSRMTGSSLIAIDERWRAWLADAVPVFGAGVMRGGLHELAEQPARPFVSLDQHLGMPLHADHKGVIGGLEPFDQAVGRDHGCSQAGAELPDALVMHAVHHDRIRAVDPSEF